MKTFILYFTILSGLLFSSCEKKQSNNEQNSNRKEALRFINSVVDIIEETHKPNKDFIDYAKMTMKDFNKDPNCAVQFDEIDYLYQQTKSSTETALLKLKNTKEFDQDLAYIKRGEEKIQVRFSAVESLMKWLNLLKSTRNVDETMIELNEALIRLETMQKCELEFKNLDRQFDQKYNL